MASDYSRTFVEQVVRMTAIPGTRAALRAGLTLNPQQIDRTMHAHLARLTPSDSPHRSAACYTIASLIAHNPTGAIPQHAPGNLGASFARATLLAADTREKSLHLLTRQPTHTLYRALIRAVLPLRTQRAVTIDFARLLDDCFGWPSRRQAVGRAWLLSYYRTATGNEAEDDTDTSDDLDGDDLPAPVD